ERKPELLVASGREKRLLERIERAKGATMLVAADVEPSAGWAQRLARIDRVVRLDSGVADDERAAAWRRLRDGSVRLATGTRSALLAPLRAPAVLALVDEHEAAHKPPGPPRMHSRDVALERAAREPISLLLTAATPRAEAGWAGGARQVGARDEGAAGARPLAGRQHRRHARHPAARAAHATCRPSHPRDAGRSASGLPGGEPAHLVAGVRRVRRGGPLRRVRDRVRLLARLGAARVPALRCRAALAGHLRGLPRPAPVAVRLGRRARGACRAPPLSHRAHRALGSRRRARSPRRGAASDGGRGR